MKKENTAIRLKKIMDERNLRQVDILNLTVPYCEKYGVKMNKSDISQYCSGKTEPNQDKLFVLGMALNVSEAWLMGFDVSMERIQIQSTLSNDEYGKIMHGAIHNLEPTGKRTGIKINVLGQVAAGIPIEAIEDIIDTEEITEEMARTGNFFGLKIRGDSMEPRMCEGDVVIVRQQDDAESGDIVIATVNGDAATCKRLRKYRDGIELISNNPSYEPMFFSNEEIENKPVKIIGKVVELRGKF